VPKIAATIWINEVEALDMFADLLELEVEEDHRLASVFRIKLSMQCGDDGLWAYLDDERAKLWNKVVVSVALDDEEQDLIEGYITQLRPHHEADESHSYLEILGMDATCLMSLEEKIKDWPGKSDGDIAREIFQSYGLLSEVDETGVVRDVAQMTIIQRETDIQFLRRLARRNGFECFAKGGVGYFRRPVLTDPPLPVLAAHFGDETNLISFDARADSLRPVKATMHRLDPVAKEQQEATVELPGQQQLGLEGALSLSPPGGVTPRIYVRQAVASSLVEMQNLSLALVDESAWFVEARGELDSSLYGAVLEARKLVPVKGVGEAFSGVYYLTNVRHLFSEDRYTQQFAARRNALAPAGPQDFAGDDSLLGGLI
jgi:Phage tail baseplate hub (GPD)